MSAKRRTLKDGSVKISAWCSCGGAYQGTSLPPKLAEQVYAEWRTLHDAPGHYPVDPVTAGRARIGHHVRVESFPPPEANR